MKSLIVKQDYAKEKALKHKSKLAQSGRERSRQYKEAKTDRAEQKKVKVARESNCNGAK